METWLKPLRRLPIGLAALALLISSVEAPFGAPFEHRMRIERPRPPSLSRAQRAERAERAERNPLWLLQLPLQPPSWPLPRLETGMHAAPINSIATDAAGRWALTVSHDKTARVWEIATGQQVQVLRPPQGEGDEGKLYAGALSPDGLLAAVGGWTKLGSDEGHTVYLFDRASGRLVRRLSGLPNVILHIAFSPDGRWLAVALGGTSGGVRVFDVASGAETGRADYGDPSYSAHFSPDSTRLLTTSNDRMVHLYGMEGGRLDWRKAALTGGGEHPSSARFSPDGRHIALGFSNSTVVQVLDAETLAQAAQPDTAGVYNDDLGSVAWGADGHYLLAGGRCDANDKCLVRRWPVGDWSSHEDLRLARDTVTDLVPLPGGAMLFAAFDPAWGVIDPGFRVRQHRDGVIADLRDQEGVFGLSADARRVRFGYDHGGQDPHTFDLGSRTLGPDDPTLAPVRATAPKLDSLGLENGLGPIDIQGWKNGLYPRLAGRPLGLEPDERSRSLAIAPDGQDFALGTEWLLRRFDRDGNRMWEQPVPEVARAVHWSPDGRFAVAGYADGTIRWHRASDGQEVLALFPHADRKRWIAWTPEGFYDASGPDAEDLMGYHLNRGKDQAGEFVSAGQLRERFYQPGLIARRLDPDGDARVAQAVKELGDVRQLLAGDAARLPTVELLSGTEASGEEEVTLTVRVHDQGGGIGGLVFYVGPDQKPQTGRQAGFISDSTESLTFPLPPGQQQIAIAARNRAGVEGPRQVVTATLTGPGVDAALHILAVGVEHYQAAGLELSNSVADAQAVAEEIAARARPLFKRGVSQPVVLRGSEASLAGIEQAFAQIKARIKPEDTLVIFLAGHGEAPVGKGYTFLPADFQRGAEGPAGEGLSERRLRDLLAQSPANTLLLLDTCDAGGAVEMIESDDSGYERLGGVSRHVVIGASRRGQFAQEGYQGHGVFTAALLRVLQNKPLREADRVLRVADIWVDTRREVRQIAQEKGGGYQQTVSAYVGSADFPLVAR